MINPAYEIERLILFGQGHGMLEKWDVVPVRNALMELLRLYKPFEGIVSGDIEATPVGILNNLLDYAAEAGILTENTVTYRDLFDTRIMGLLMPRQSEVIGKFQKNVEQYSIEKATDEFYHLSKASNYIRTERIDRNLYWTTSTGYGDIEITVNLSKPEKDPKAIAAARNFKQSNYPKCLLCLENVGYQGRVNHPARQNHRVIPVELNHEQWYFQYSPYVYYNEHCIVFCEEHRPMKLSEETFIGLLDFIELFPHYFIGSNADLPIVGGSILSHDHFQGGRHIFTMETAGIEKYFIHQSFPGIKAGIVKWPMSVIRLSGSSKFELVKMAMYILENWREYSKPEAQVISYSMVNGEKIPHNTVTPIARINKNHEFELDLVLRNNRTSQEHPYGIFHPHEELHHIKKENIGLIEVMGLAVLPGRLDDEMKAIEHYLKGEKAFDEKELKLDEALEKHIPWIRTLIGKYGMVSENNRVAELLKYEISGVFLRALEDAGVFKRNRWGQKLFVEYMERAGFNDS